MTWIAVHELPHSLVLVNLGHIRRIEVSSSNTDAAVLTFADGTRMHTKEDIVFYLKFFAGEPNGQSNTRGQSTEAGRAGHGGGYESARADTALSGENYQHDSTERMEDNPIGSSDTYSGR